MIAPRAARASGPPPGPAPLRRPGATVAGVGIAVLVIAGLAPEPVVLGGLRLAALAVAVTGAALLVARAGAADLAAGAAAGAGAYAGGVGAALLSLPVAVGLPAAVLGGAAVGAAGGALHARLGRALGALTSLAIGGAVVAVAAAWPAVGGVAGFHAVGLPTPFGDRADLVAVGAVLVLALLAAGRVVGARATSGAAVAVHAPAVAASLGRRPPGDGARLGAAAGGLLGAGGATLAAVDGSVLPDAYGLGLTAALGLAALLGGVPPLGPVLGALVVWGPSTVWPLVPLVGGAPPLLVMGPVGLLLLAVRHGRPLVPWRDEVAPVAPAPDGDAAPRPPAHRRGLELSGTPTPAGPVELTVAPGEVVALVGPNGAGKSTLLARVGGQLPDGGTVALPRSPVARARAGVARTWQRPPRLPDVDAARLVVTGPAAAAAARWATAVLTGPGDGTDRDGPPGVGRPDDPGVAQLVRLAAVGPAVALLDEPTDLAPDRVLAFVRGLARAGTAVLLVDHRPEVVSGADRIVTLEPAAVSSP